MGCKRGCIKGRWKRLYYVGIGVVDGDDDDGSGSGLDDVFAGYFWL